MAELVDALDSKSSGSNIVWVRVPPQAPEGNLSELFKSLDFNTKKYQFQKEVGTFFMLKERIDLK